MPIIRDQGIFPFCFGFSAWTLYMQNVCKKTGDDCKHIDPKISPSPLALTSLGREYGTSSSFFIDGGNPRNVLRNFTATENEAHFRYEESLRIKPRNRDEALKIWEKLRLKGIDYEEKSKENNICADCLAEEINSIFNINIGSDDVLKISRKNKRFDTFLYAALFYKTDDNNPNDLSFANISHSDLSAIFGKALEKSQIYIGSFRAEYWPIDEKRKFKFEVDRLGDSMDFSYAEMLNVLKENFQKNTPVGVTVCRESVNGCGASDDAHDVVLAGYNRFCKDNGACIDGIKVANSWGQIWQDQNNDGWVDARNLYHHIPKKLSIFVWLDPK